MTRIATLCAVLLCLLFVVPAHALPLYTASGWLVENSQPNAECAVNGSGTPLYFDGNSPINGAFMTMSSLGLGGAGHLGNCTTTGELEMHYLPAGTTFDDLAATIQVWKPDGNTTTLPDSLTVTGTESGMSYAAHFFNPHIDSYGRRAYDFTFIRPNNPPPSTGSEILEPPPPIRR